jgi:transcriptional regulator with XRE-family HTH domain
VRALIAERHSLHKPMKNTKLRAGDNAPLGARVRAIRRGKDLTQEYVVFASGAYSDSRSLRGIEAGSFMPSRSRLVRLLRYGLEIDDVSTIDEILNVAGYVALSVAESAALDLHIARDIGFGQVPPAVSKTK